MRFYLNEKKISAKKAKELLSKSQIKEARESIIADPNEQVSYMTAAGVLRVEI